jgi:hypothetical protein
LCICHENIDRQLVLLRVGTLKIQSPCKNGRAKANPAFWDPLAIIQFFIELPHIWWVDDLAQSR